MIGHAGEPMSAVDRAWLEMDDVHNPMVVSAIMELSAVADVEAMVDQLVSRLLHYRRFRQRVDLSHGAPRWCDSGELAMSYHLRIFHLTEDSPEHDIVHAVCRELEHRLDRALPLWRITVFVRSGGRVTVLFRAHHALADGVALVHVLMHCTDGHAARAARSGGADRPFSAALLRLEQTAERLKTIGHLLVDRIDRQEFIDARLHEGRETLAAIGRVLSLPEDNPPGWRAELSGCRAVAWVDDIDFRPFRARARRLGVKINDLFLAALAGAVGLYLREQNDSLDADQNLRVSIPVNLRAADDGELGNCFGLVLLDLPVGIADWRQRLAVVSRRMQALKHSPEARAMLTGLAAAGHLPVRWEKSLVGLLAGKAAAVVSNLPGPRRALRLHGARIDSLVFWPPQAGGIGIGISLFSYAGRVSVGISADESLIAEPMDLIAAFKRELARMLHPRLAAHHLADRVLSGSIGRPARSLAGAAD